MLSNINNTLKLAIHMIVRFHNLYYHFSHNEKAFNQLYIYLLISNKTEYICYESGHVGSEIFKG